jgi:hypothetical protein
MAAELFAEAHGRAFRRLSADLGFAIEGLAVAVRRPRRYGFIQAGLANKLERLGTAFAFARHATRPNVDYLLVSMKAQLQRAQGQGVVAAPREKQEEQEEAHRHRLAVEEAACVTGAAQEATREFEDQEKREQEETKRLQ